MASLKPSIIVLSFALISLFQVVPSIAAKKSYVVYLGSHSHGQDATEADFEAVADSHYDFLASFLGSREKAEESIIVSYKRSINGFATFLDEAQAAEIAKDPSVVSVFLNQERKLHTTRSWGFMMLENNGVPLNNSLWERANFGEGVIIGNIDTGVWYESKSFSDEGYGPVPSRWKGICQNSTTGFSCNRKLIGGRFFSKGREASGVVGNVTKPTPLDFEGHGTHTLSTAGGNFVPGASVFGVGNGTASGGSPRARVSAYKVCWPTPKGSGCFDSDIIEAFEAAIHDGVDVITASVGGDPGDYFGDGISIGAFHAVKKGIAVVCSAGNSGPAAGTVSNVSPWIITVAASTLDRRFQAIVELKSGQRFKGTSFSTALKDQKLYPLISALDAKNSRANATSALLCKPDSLDPKKVSGKIVVCLRGDTARVNKGAVVSQAGAVGMILCNDEPNANDIVADPHLLPAAHVTYTDGVAIFAYLNSTKNPEGTLFPPTGEIDSKPAPVMADFSSAGPNTVTPGILKPDITAPGVNIIAAFTGAVRPTAEPSDHRTTPYNVMSGTSMSCPHVAGVVGLLKAYHPDWSPAAIRSAIVTSARTRDNNMMPMTDATATKATPFNYGHGHIRPNRAIHPGLIYDLTNNDYLDLLCTIGYNVTTVQLFSDRPYVCPSKKVSLIDFNYPSITAPSLNGTVTVKRTVRNVGAPGDNYHARFIAPPGVAMRVEPKSMYFKRRGDVKSFTVTLTDKGHGLEGYQFGRLIWSDGTHYVRSPVVVQMAATA